MTSLHRTHSLCSEMSSQVFSWSNADTGVCTDCQWVVRKGYQNKTHLPRMQLLFGAVLCVQSCRGWAM